MKTPFRSFLVYIGFIVFSLSSCNKQQKISNEQIDSLELLKGEIALCGPEKFGTVNFGLGCKESVREDFELAIALLHSFEYAEAEKVFAHVIENDPECAIAYWGVAMSNYHPLWSPPNEQELSKSDRALEIAKDLKNKTERESRYIDAISNYYTDWETLDHKTRASMYVEAMKEIYNEYPDDTEAAIFYALALNSIVDPSDKNFTLQKQAGEILNKIFPDKPDHPGVAHYIIHTYDYPELAHLGLNSARKYAEIAPSSAHAQHMPSHIFTRLGLWEESIESNMRSATSAECYINKLGIKGNWFNELHALDYLMYAYIQTAQLDKAKEILDYTNKVEIAYPFNFASAYALAAVPSRYALETKNWEEAAKLKLLISNGPWDNFPWSSSIVYFTNAVGQVHTSDLDGARASLDKLKTNRAILNEKNEKYKATQVSIQISAAEGWIAYGEGDLETAEIKLTEAAIMEEGTGKHPVTPGEVLPAREQLGDFYMMQKEYVKALQAYETNLIRNPNRYNSIYNAIISAEESGQNDKVQEYKSKLEEITKTVPQTEAAVQQGSSSVRLNFVTFS